MQPTPSPAPNTWSSTIGKVCSSTAACFRASSSCACATGSHCRCCQATLALCCSPMPRSTTAAICRCWSKKAFAARVGPPGHARSRSDPPARQRPHSGSQCRLRQPPRFFQIRASPAALHRRRRAAQPQAVSHCVGRAQPRRDPRRAAAARAGSQRAWRVKAVARAARRLRPASQPASQPRQRERRSQRTAFASQTTTTHP
jgi:hypothetical protein